MILILICVIIDDSSVTSPYDLHISIITIKGPLVLWLQGGPGWPSMFGMFKENGPFLIHVEKKGDESSLIMMMQMFMSMFGMFKENGPFLIHVERKCEVQIFRGHRAIKAGAKSPLLAPGRLHPLHWQPGLFVCSHLFTQYGIHSLHQKPITCRHSEIWKQMTSVNVEDKSVVLPVWLKRKPLFCSTKLSPFPPKFTCWTKVQVGTGFSHTKSSSSQPTTDAQVPLISVQ